MNNLKLNITIIVLILSCVLNAQNKKRNILDVFGKECHYCKKNDTGNHVHDDHKNPYTINFKKEIPFFATGIGLVTTGFIVKARNEEDPFTIEELQNLDRSKINKFDRGATTNSSSRASYLSDVILYSSSAFPLYFLINHHTKKDFLPLIVMSAEIYTITGGFVLNSKFLFNRSRPLTYNPEFSNKERTSSSSKLSFFSGHTAQTASFSVFLAKAITDYHPHMKRGLKVGVWSFALTLPATIGFLRIKGGHHFNTDVMTGYAIGAAVGFLVPHLHKKKKDSKLSLTPFNYGTVTGINLTWKID